MSSRDGFEAMGALPIHITPQGLLSEWQRMNEKIVNGSRKLAALTEDQLAIATTPKEEIWRQDMVRLYRYLPLVEKPSGLPQAFSASFALSLSPSGFASTP